MLSVISPSLTSRGCFLKSASGTAGVGGCRLIPPLSECRQTKLHRRGRHSLHLHLWSSLEPAQSDFIAPRRLAGGTTQQPGLARSTRLDRSASTRRGLLARELLRSLFTRNITAPQRRGRRRQQAHRSWRTSLQASFDLMVPYRKC